MWKPLLLASLVVATPALADNRRVVDISATFTKTIHQAPTTEDDTGKCPKTEVETTDMTIKGQLVISGVKIIDTAKSISLSMPNTTAKKMTGGATLEMTSTRHKVLGCDEKEDTQGAASARAEAKDVRLFLELDKRSSEGSVSMSASFPTASGTGKLVSVSHEGTNVVDAGPMLGAYAGLLSAMGPVSLLTAPRWAEPSSQFAPLVEMAKRMAQSDPVAVKTTGNAIDVDFIQENTTDLSKDPPPPEPGHKKGGTLKVTTELHVHITPAKP